MAFVCVNGTFFPENQPILSTGNSSYKWGEGLFETIRVQNGRILLENLHWERLAQSMNLIGFQGPIPTDLSDQILELCRRNACENLARVRYSISRQGDGDYLHLIEAIPLDPSVVAWKSEGWQVGIYPYARKSRDAYANLKSASFLPYRLAAAYAREQNWDDALVLNTNNHLADSSIANLFLVRQGEVFTPMLSEGCINGVMRRLLIEELKRMGITVHQARLNEQDLLDADEAFLSNAIMGMRSIYRFREKQYEQSLTRKWYHQCLPTFIV